MIMVHDLIRSEVTLTLSATLGWQQSSASSVALPSEHLLYICAICSVPPPPSSPSSTEASLSSILFLSQGLLVHVPHSSSSSPGLRSRLLLSFLLELFPRSSLSAPRWMQGSEYVTGFLLHTFSLEVMRLLLVSWFGHLFCGIYACVFYFEALCDISSKKGTLRNWQDVR